MSAPRRPRAKKARTLLTCTLCGLDTLETKAKLQAHLHEFSSVYVHITPMRRHAYVRLVGTCLRHMQAAILDHLGDAGRLLEVKETSGGRYTDNRFRVEVRLECPLVVFLDVLCIEGQYKAFSNRWRSYERYKQYLWRAPLWCSVFVAGYEAVLRVGFADALLAWMKQSLPEHQLPRAVPEPHEYVTLVWPHGTDVAEFLQCCGFCVQEQTMDDTYTWLVKLRDVPLVAAASAHRPKVHPDGAAIGPEEGAQDADV